MTGEECRKLACDHKIIIQGTAMSVAVNTISSFHYTPTGRISEKRPVRWLELC